MLTNRLPGASSSDIAYGDVGVWNTRCSCGAVHIVFTSKKAYPGQERDAFRFECQRCRTPGLELDLYDSGWYEVHLKEDLPADRVGWLPPTSTWEVSQRDYPLLVRPPSATLSRIPRKYIPLLVWTLLVVVFAVIWLMVRASL
jgi:hypothetical protein